MILNVGTISEKRKIEVIPSASSSLTYNGSNQSPTWLNYDPEQLTISGTTSATNAGTYYVAFAPTKKYKWADGSTGAKTVSWTINKAAGSLSLSASSGTLVSKNKTTSFTVTRTGNGAISATSSNTGIATVSVSGTTVTVTSKGYGSATITVSVAAGTNHTAPSSKTYTITVNYYYLYNYGAVTGSMEKQARMLEAGAGRALKPQWYYNASSFTTTMGSSGGYTANGGTVYWIDAIDLSNFTTLRFNGSFTNNYNAYRGVAVWSSMSGYIWNGMAASLRDLSNGSGTINISGLNGKYYIGFWLYNSGTSITCNYLRLE